MVPPNISFESLEKILLESRKRQGINVIKRLRDNIRNALQECRGKTLLNGTIITKNSNKNLLECRIQKLMGCLESLGR